MDVSWDPEKNAKNIRERSLPFSLAGIVLDDYSALNGMTRNTVPRSRIVGKLSALQVNCFLWFIWNAKIRPILYQFV
jgi:uncharacterized DUF497 family protein